MNDSYIPFYRFQKVQNFYLIYVTILFLIFLFIYILRQLSGNLYILQNNGIFGVRYHQILIRYFVIVIIISTFKCPSAVYSSALIMRGMGHNYHAGSLRIDNFTQAIKLIHRQQDSFTVKLVVEMKLAREFRNTQVLSKFEPTTQCLRGSRLINQVTMDFRRYYQQFDNLF